MNKTLRKTGIAALALTSIFVLSACGTEQPAEVVSPAGDVIIEETPSIEETPIIEETAPTNTVPVGTKVTVGDWDVKVTKVTKDAGRLIEKTNNWNDPADDQYMLVTFQATYHGDNRKADSEYDLDWSFTDKAQVIHDPANVVTPADSDALPTDARKGGTITYDVAFDVPAKQINGGIITVDAYNTDSYADFTL